MGRGSRPHVLAGHLAVCHKEVEGKDGLVGLGLCTTKRCTAVFFLKRPAVRKVNYVQ